MLCNALKSIPAAELFGQMDVVERIELETPQVVYIVRCHAFHAAHSVEFSVDDASSVWSKSHRHADTPARSRMEEQPRGPAASSVKGRHPKTSYRSTRHPPGHCYGEEEVLAALADLAQEEIEQLLGFARFRLVGNTARPGFVEVEDLFIDAVIRTIQRKRSWTRSVGVFNHLFAVMRSIGHQRLKQAGRYTTLNVSSFMTSLTGL